eukprot:COSAG05_NODE_2007_length_3714_cov_6.483084_4_plen_65_part_00
MWQLLLALATMTALKYTYLCKNLLKRNDEAKIDLAASLLCNDDSALRESMRQVRPLTYTSIRLQ